MNVLIRVHLETTVNPVGSQNDVRLTESVRFCFSPLVTIDMKVSSHSLVNE